MFLTECDFLVSVSAEIRVIPGGTCAHVNTRIPGLLINGIRPVLASFALRGKQPEFSGLRLQKKSTTTRSVVSGAENRVSARLTH